jgi:carbamoyltransferase
MADNSYTLAFKPAIGNFGGHDPSAVIFEDGHAVFGIEEERLTRSKHAVGQFPTNAIQACLDYTDIEFADIDKILLPYKPSLQLKILPHRLKNALQADSLSKKAHGVNQELVRAAAARFAPYSDVRSRLLSEFDGPCPPITLKQHHACHAASAFHPSGFDEALVVTIDGKGEHDSTVVWTGTPDGLRRVKTYEFPNSLGHFFGAITEFLGFRAHNGEGKVMGLAPYGSENEAIERQLRNVIETGADYDVTELTAHGRSIRDSVEVLETTLGRQSKSCPVTFTEWEKDLAFTAQKLLEETIVNVVESYCRRFSMEKVALAGGVALNCKMNKRIMESDAVEELFVQPVAHDGGLALGAGMLTQRPQDVEEMTDVYLGSSYDTDEITSLLETNKIEYEQPDDLTGFVAEKIADGNLIGWFQGRMEMGPRALGNRSILADPRTEDSRDRVNKYVKHREIWRPFAPSMTVEGADRYLHNWSNAPFMIKTFDTAPDSREEIQAVIHRGDETTRPQVVTPEANPRYHELITEFGERTGVPVLLNTSFNDHGEPVVRTPVEALKDFYGMGLDYLVVEDIVVSK